MDHLGVTAVQIGAMFFLYNNEGCQQKDLGAGLGLNNPAITGLVNRMEKAGLVIKTTCNKDARAFRLTMTQRGREILKKALPLLEEMNDLLTEGFSEQETGVVFRFLHNIITYLDKEAYDEQHTQGL